MQRYLQQILICVVPGWPATVIAQATSPGEGIPPAEEMRPNTEVQLPVTCVAIATSHQEAIQALRDQIRRVVDDLGLQADRQRKLREQLLAIERESNALRSAGLNAARQARLNVLDRQRASLEAQWQTLAAQVAAQQKRLKGLQDEIARQEALFERQRRARNC